jgi:hypothetical protein
VKIPGANTAKDDQQKEKQLFHLLSFSCRTINTKAVVPGQARLKLKKSTGLKKWFMPIIAVSNSVLEWVY